MAKTKPFDKNLAEYEQWFDKNSFVYKSELEAIRKLIPTNGRGVEVGIGSGLFAKPLDIKEGCDPSANMRIKAESRGINTKECVAESLPYSNNSIDYILMVTTICFVDNAEKTFQEIHRVLKPSGCVIMAYVDKNSPIGKIYLKNKEKSLFYKNATFYSTEELANLFLQNSFIITDTLQTVFGNTSEIHEVQKPKTGYGEGSFVVLKALKK